MPLGTQLVGAIGALGLIAHISAACGGFAAPFALHSHRLESRRMGAEHPLGQEEDDGNLRRTPRS